MSIPLLKDSLLSQCMNTSSQNSILDLSLKSELFKNS